jgi:hypothetical protein
MEQSGAEVCRPGAIPVLPIESQATDYLDLNTENLHCDLDS